MKILLVLLLLVLAAVLFNNLAVFDLPPANNTPAQPTQADYKLPPQPEPPSQPEKEKEQEQEQKQEPVLQQIIEIPLTPEPVITEPLDLSLPINLQYDAPQLEKPEALLPNVFQEIEKQNRLLFSGSPILKAAEEDDTLPTLEGATIEIEVKID